MIELVITNVVVDAAANKHFGFAVADDGTEYFIPRATIIMHEIDPGDVGKRIRANIRRNTNPIEGKANLDHVMPQGLEELIDD